MLDVEPQPLPRGGGVVVGPDHRLLGPLWSEHEHGAFVYIMHNAPPIFFGLRPPSEEQYAQWQKRKHIEERRHAATTSNTSAAPSAAHYGAGASAVLAKLPPAMLARQGTRNISGAKRMVTQSLDAAREELQEMERGQAAH